MPCEICGEAAKRGEVIIPFGYKWRHKRCEPQPDLCWAYARVIRKERPPGNDSWWL